MAEKKCSLGIDIGSTTVKIAVLNEENKLLFSDYRRHFARIQETLEALPCREFSFLVLGIDALLSATELRSTPAFYEFVDSVLLYAHGIWIYIYSLKYMKKS